MLVVCRVSGDKLLPFSPVEDTGVIINLFKKYSSKHQCRKHLLIFTKPFMYVN